MAPPRERLGADELAHPPTEERIRRLQALAGLR
jgi:Zn-dependent protease with chaperone function